MSSDSDSDGSSGSGGGGEAATGQEGGGQQQSFEDLGVVSVLAEACASLQWERPTPVQAQSLPYTLAGRDVIGLAQTGSGKTGAFALPVLQRLLVKPRALFALVVAPTRELAFQIGEQFEALGSCIGARSTVIVGGVDTMEQSLALAREPHIVVATPGRLVWHLENTKGFSLRSIAFLNLSFLFS